MAVEIIDASADSILEYGVRGYKDIRRAAGAGLFRMPPGERYY